MVKIYSVEGNIGSGKSTLLRMLKERYGHNKDYVFLQEPVSIWETITDETGENIISKFYKDQKKYSFAFQMMAYISRLHLIREAIIDNPSATIICERSIFTDRNVFAKMLHDDGMIEDIEYAIYLKWFDEFIKDIPVTGIIYVKASPEKSFERVVKRGREGESIPLEYLTNCHNYHEDWISNERISILTLDADEDKDTVSDDYDIWVNIIDEFIHINNSPKMSEYKKFVDICVTCHGV